MARESCVAILDKEDGLDGHPGGKFAKNASEAAHVLPEGAMTRNNRIIHIGTGRDHRADEGTGQQKEKNENMSHILFTIRVRASG